MINCFLDENDEPLDDKQKHGAEFIFKKSPLRDIIKKTKCQATKSICYISDKGLCPECRKHIQEEDAQPNKIMGKHSNRSFTLKDMQMNNKLMKRCSISLVIREMQSKATKR